MTGVDRIALQDQITEEIILNLRTQNCQFIQSRFCEAKSSMSWNAFLDELIEKQAIYYIDVEKTL